MTIADRSPFHPARSDSSSAFTRRGEHAPRTRIVAIGAAGGVDTQLLDAIFTACIAGADAGAAG
jgi:hypothetical protein